MKKTLLLILFLSQLTKSYSQQWFDLDGGFIGNGQFDRVDALCSDTIHNILWAGGSFQTGHAGDTLNNLAFWDGLNWNPVVFKYPMDTIIGFPTPEINNLTMFQGKLSLSWNGATASTNTLHYVSQLSVDSLSNNEISIDTSMAHSIGKFNDDINCMCIYHDTLYAAGRFSQYTNPYQPFNSNTTYAIAKWDGNDYVAVGGGIGGVVNGMCVFNDKLIAVGLFEYAGGVFCKNIAQWDGATWAPVGNGIGGTAGNNEVNGVNAACEYNGKLYAGGDFYASAVVPATGLLKLSGNTWVSAGDYFINVNAMKVMDDKLYVGAGTCLNPSNWPWDHVAVYNDTAWSATGMGPVSSGANGLKCLEEFQNNLYAGGYFHFIGDTVVNTYAGFVARFDPTPVGIKEIDKTQTIVKIFPNPFTSIATIEYETTNAGKSTVTVENCLGQVVLTQNLNIKNQKGTAAIDMSNYASGMYFIKCFDGEQQTVLKIVKN